MRGQRGGGAALAHPSADGHPLPEGEGRGQTEALLGGADEDCYDTAVAVFCLTNPQSYARVVVYFMSLFPEGGDGEAGAEKFTNLEIGDRISEMRAWGAG